MRPTISHLALGLGLVLLLCAGDSCAWGQTADEINYSGWGDTRVLRCGGCCMPVNQRAEKLSFYPIVSVADCKLISPRGAVRRPVTRYEWKQCQCINEAISLYSLIWLGLERKEVTPEQARAQMTAHLECKAHCDRWEDCENLLRFIEREISSQREGTINSEKD